MLVDGAVVCRAHGAVHEQSVTCGTVERVVAGARAWVVSPYSLYRLATHFSGFLIAAD
jgi:hypothetical protein